MARGTAGTEPSFGFLVSGDGIASVPDRVSTPGPALVLRRNEPVEITVVNHLGESTAVHWHGMELESIYDGVHVGDVEQIEVERFDVHGQLPTIPDQRVARKIGRAHV